MILDACFNITGDAVMLCLPIPLVMRAQVPLKRLAQYLPNMSLSVYSLINRKLALVGVFSLGFLVVSLPFPTLSSHYVC